MPAFSRHCPLKVQASRKQHRSIMKIRPSAASRLSLAVLTVVLTNISCHSKTSPDPTTYTISGVVRASADLSPLEGASIQASGTGANGVWTPRFVVSDAAGHYAISGLRDSVTVVSIKPGFFNASADLKLTQDTVLNLAMMKGAAEGGDLVVNQTISGSIDGADEKCDPTWDRNAPCRDFSFIPDTPRVYQFVVSFDCAQLELHVFNGAVRLFSISRGSPITKDIGLGTGTYKVRLMAYYDCRRFDLTVR
jgi:hypothetical protein